MAPKLLICLLFVVGAFTDISNTAEQETPALRASTIAPTPDPPELPTTDPTGTPTTDPTGTPTTDPTGTATPDTTDPAATTPAVTPTTPGACVTKPCGRGSTCQERANGTRVCLCLTGDYYDETLKQCVLGKVFPADLGWEGVYTEEMSDPTSVEFEKVADSIMDKLKETYGTQNGYEDSVVTKLSKASAATKTMRKVGIIATVEIKFNIASTITAEQVKKVADGKLSFTAIDICKSNPCDTTTECTKGESDGTFICKCLPNYISTDFSERLCVACPNNYKAIDSSTCKKCSFGYTGFNCEDNWQLILVIVGTVLGGLLLVTLIVIPVMAVKTKKKLKKEKATDYAKPSLNPGLTKIPQISNGSVVPRPTPVQAAPARAGFGGNAVPRIPRATPNESWDRSNLEMVPSNSRQNLVPAGRNSRRFDDRDDSNTYNNLPKGNPYAIGRPQVNPYASGQGHSNPYYRNDEGRRY